jgi:hypothetical protein
VDVKSDNIGRVDQANVNPLMGGDGLFTILTQKFQLVFQGYLNLLVMMREMKARSDVHALSVFSLDYENDELLRLAHEVWGQKKLAPLKAMDGKRVQFTVRYSDPARRPRHPEQGRYTSKPPGGIPFNPEGTPHRRNL